jgi:hypothetical protein
MQQELSWGEKSAVSLLNKASSNRHLDDGALTSIWTAAVASGEPATDPHLNACAQCRARYAAFSSWLERMRDDATAEADEVFPTERLAAQQAQIFRRLEALERPARVIAFPKFGRPITSTQGNAQRWVAAAAAAGLVIGLAAGQLVDVRRTFSRQQVEPQATNARLTTADTPAAQATAPSPVSAADEALFVGNDAGPSNVRVSTLKPMDDITPRARDFDQPR